MRNRQSSSRKDKRTQVLILLLSLISVAAISVSVWTVFFRENNSPFVPDYEIPEKEEHAEPIPNDPDEKLESPQGGGAVSLTYANQVGVDLGSGEISLLFANPRKSNQDMVLQIVIQDQVIAQSGTVSPGYRVTKLELLEGMTDLLSVGGYNGKFVVLYYDQDTGEKSIINTEIPVQISVSQ